MYYKYIYHESEETEDSSIEINFDQSKQEEYGRFSDQYKGYYFFREQAFSDSKRVEEKEIEELKELQQIVFESKELIEGKDTRVEEYVFQENFNLSKIQTKEIVYTNSYVLIGTTIILLALCLIFAVFKWRKRKRTFAHTLEVMAKKEDV